MYDKLKVLLNKTCNKITEDKEDKLIEIYEKFKIFTKDQEIIYFFKEDLDRIVKEEKEKLIASRKI